MTYDFRGGYFPLPALISRLFNSSLALLLMIIGIPAFVIIAIMIKMQDRGPLFYKGIRLGQNKKPFAMYKFRTLIPNAESLIGAELLSHKHKMITKSGVFLRDSRLDELPQLFNILKGDMDFLGPRPEREIIYEQLCKNIEGYDKRFLVKPGLVGYSQLFTPHGTPKKIRALIDNHFLLKKRKLSWEIYIVLKTVTSVNIVIGAKAISYIWNGFISRKILRRYKQEKRELKRIAITEGKVSVGRKASDENFVFSNNAELVDINEAAFLIYTNDKITREDRVFKLEIDHIGAKANDRIKRKTALCHGEIFRESLLNDNEYKYSYIINYTPFSPFNAYILDQYFLRKSIMLHKIV